MYEDAKSVRRKDEVYDQGVSRPHYLRLHKQDLRLRSVEDRLHRARRGAGFEDNSRGLFFASETGKHSEPRRLYLEDRDECPCQIHRRDGESAVRALRQRAGGGRLHREAARRRDKVKAAARDRLPVKAAEKDTHPSLLQEHEARRYRERALTAGRNGKVASLGGAGRASGFGKE